MKYITDIAQVDIASWKSFVQKHPEGNIFQTPEIFFVYKGTRNYQPVIVIAFDEDHIAGVLLGVIQKEHKGLPGYLSSRCIIWGGPLVFNNNILTTKEMLSILSQTVKNRSLYIQFRNIFDTSPLSKSFIDNGFSFENHSDILINLNQPFEQLKPGIHHSRLKNYQKSLKKGSYFKEILDLDLIEEGYILLKQTYKRIKLPLPHVSFFKNLAKELSAPGYIKFYALYFASQMIGFRVVFTFKHTIYDYYAGSSPEHSNKYPNDVLILETLKRGCEAGYEIFDFGGAGKPDIPYAVRDYKLQFGGQLVCYGRYNKINNKVLFNLSKAAFKVYKLTMSILKR